MLYSNQIILHRRKIIKQNRIKIGLVKYKNNEGKLEWAKLSHFILCAPR